MNVLIIDDDESHRLFLRQALTKRFGVVVSEARNGVEGLRSLEKQVPDLILLDLWMPVMNGQDFLERMRQEPAWSDVPVIVMSSIRDREIIQKLLRLRIMDYMLKPITLDQLSERMERFGITQLTVL